MEPASRQSRAADAREAPRLSTFLAATLYCDGASSPVKIRNIASAGALLDAAVVPPAGALVQLVRGGLIVHGLVAWSAEGRCGLKFSGSIDVQEWRAAPANREQERVDEVVRLVKAGAVPLPVASLSQPQDSDEVPDHCGELSGELRRTSDLLESLGEVLANDPDVVARHGDALQSLDIALQMIGSVDAILATHKETCTEAPGRPGLRICADQALLQGRPRG